MARGTLAEFTPPEPRTFFAAQAEPATSTRSRRAGQFSSRRGGPARPTLCLVNVRATGGAPQPVVTASSPSRDQSVPGTVTLMMRGVSARCGGRSFWAVLK